MINMLTFPQHVLESVFSWLDDTSLLRLREVCKSSKAIVEHSIINSRQSVVEYLTVDKIDHTSTKLSFTYASRMVYCMWKIFLRALLHSKITHIRMKTKNFKRFAIRYHRLFISRTLSSTRLTLCLKMGNEKLRRFLDYLKPLIRKAAFLELRLAHDHTSIVQMLSNFFDGKIIPSVIVEKANIDFTHYVDLFRQLQTELVNYTIALTRANAKSLLQLADIMKQLCIEVVQICGDITGRDIVSIIRGMLNRRCEFLMFEVFDTDFLISLDDMENLLEIFHHTETRVCFFARTSVARIKTQIGVYTVRTDDDDTRCITITHFEMV